MLGQAIIYLVMLISTLPVWNWYSRRIFDGSDEPWGVFALLTMAVFVFAGIREKTANEEKPDLLIPALILILYSASYCYLPNLLRAVFAMTAFTSVVCCLNRGRVSILGIWGLAMLSLPLIASLQFYVGFPLRVLVGEISVFI